MAEIYPPSMLRDELHGAAERGVRDALREQLDGRWTVMPSVWLTERDHGGSHDREIDFLLAHPDHGLICLEVKGGGIEIHDGDWTSDGRDGREVINNPFRQASDGMYALRRRLQRGAVAAVAVWPLARGVVFPETTVLQDQDLGSDGERALVIDRTEVRDLEPALLRLVAFAAGEHQVAGPGREAILELRRVLAPTIERRVPLAQMIYEETEEIERLTADQQRAFAGLDKNPQVVVEGPAGSGKTVLAVRHAHRLAAQGKQVLFVCFNKGLAAELERRQAAAGVLFTTFHRLCLQLAREAGVELKYAPADNPPPEYWDTELPDALMTAIAELGARFDALVIDEAQDFQESWFQTLTLLLKDEERANIWIFRDARQSIHRGGMKVPDGYTHFELACNCRNTKAIHTQACGVAPDLEQVTVLGPTGRRPEVVKNGDQPAAVAETIARLCRDEEVPPQDIVVLSAHGREHSRVFEGLTGDYTFTRERPDPTPGKVFFSSIRGFKGLEAPVVIICETEDLEPGTEDSQLYVGYTRATSHLIVVESP